MKLNKMKDLKNKVYVNIFFKRDDGQLVSAVGRKIVFDKVEYYFKLDQHKILTDNNVTKKRAAGWLPLCNQ